MSEISKERRLRLVGSRGGGGNGYNGVDKTSGGAGWWGHGLWGSCCASVMAGAGGRSNACRGGGAGAGRF